MQLQVAPSILSADFLHLEDDIRMLNANADIIHLDVMDGTFVPNISFGFSVIDAVARVAEKPLDAHLMVVEPQRWFERLAKDGVSMVSFHCEAAGRHTSEYIDRIHALGMKAGVAADPDVPVKKLFKYIGKADFFLVMSVFAGFGGQKFIYESIDRICALKEAVASSKAPHTLIEVDGGVAADNVRALRDAGVDIVVAGSSVFNSENPASAISTLKNL